MRCAPRNAALFMGAKEVGALRPGRHADIVLVEDLQAFAVSAVFIGGRLCAENGKMCATIADPESGYERRNTMNVKGTLSRRDFLIPARDESVRLHALSFLNGDPFETRLETLSFPVRDGFADIASAPDCVTMAVVERHNATGNIGIAPARNIGLTRGAIAGTVAHDSHNLFVFGKSPDDMLIAARRLIDIGGGFAAAESGAITAEVSLPLAGLLSLKPAAQVAEEMAAMKRVVNAMGIHGESPVHMLTWFCLPVLPEARLTDKGLVDTRTQKPISLFAG